MPPLDPALIALIGTLCGGVGLKLLEHWLGKSKVRIDEASKLRDELRIEINAQREEIKTLEEQVDKWKNDYWALREEFLQAKLTYSSQLDELKRQLEATQKQIEVGPPK